MGARSTDLKMITPAVVPERPFKPRIVLNIILAAGFGLLLSVGLSFLLHNLETPRVVREVEFPVEEKIVEVRRQGKGVAKIPLNKGERPRIWEGCQCADPASDWITAGLTASVAMRSCSFRPGDFGSRTGRNAMRLLMIAQTHSIQNPPPLVTAIRVSPLSARGSRDEPVDCAVGIVPSLAAAGCRSAAGRLHALRCLLANLALPFRGLRFGRSPSLPFNSGRGDTGVRRKPSVRGRVFCGSGSRH